LFADYRKTPRNLRSTSSRLWVLFGISLGLIVPIFGGRPVLVMIMSQALTIMASPVVLILMMILQNRESIMGKYKATPVFNIIMLITILFTIYMSVSGVIGIIGLV